MKKEKGNKKRNAGVTALKVIGGLLLTVVMVAGIAFGIFWFIDEKKEAVQITVKAEDVIIYEGDTVPQLKAQVTAKGDTSKYLSIRDRYKAEQLLEELQKGEGYQISCDGDGTTEGSYPIQTSLDKNLGEMLKEKWSKKVKVRVENATLTVRNPIGEWQDRRLRRWDGTYATSEYVTDKGKTYYFDGEGNLVSGWQDLEDGRHYFNEQGEMQSGWIRLEEGDAAATYYLAENGVMQVGWQTLGENTYYFEEDGKMMTGQTQIDNLICSFGEDGILQWTKERPTVVDNGKPMIALTFDDGPGPRTEELVAMLSENHAHATFFMQGINVSRYPGAVSAIQNAGCELGNHTFDHPQLSSLDGNGIKEEVQNTNSAIQAIAGQSATVLRPPYGAVNDTVKANAGMPMILWSVDTLDWKTRNAQKTIDHVLQNVKDGDIVLMHDIHSETVDAAKKLVPELIKEGYQLVTVSELAQARGTTMENGRVYTSFWK